MFSILALLTIEVNAQEVFTTFQFAPDLPSNSTDVVLDGCNPEVFVAVSLNPGRQLRRNTTNPQDGPTHSLAIGDSFNPSDETDFEITISFSEPVEDPSIMIYDMDNGEDLDVLQLETLSGFSTFPTGFPGFINSNGVISAPNGMINQDGMLSWTGTFCELSFTFDRQTNNNPNDGGTLTIFLNNLTFKCSQDCCDATNSLVTNGDFKEGDSDFDSDYDPSTGIILPGNYAVVTGAEAAQQCDQWQIEDPDSCDPNTGSFLLVNGLTSQTGSSVIWRQELTLRSNENQISVCAQFKNLPTCCFNVDPVLTLSIPALNYTETITVDAGEGPCDWQSFSTSIDVSTLAPGQFDLEFLLDESSVGDGNDLALDNIVVTPLVVNPLASANFSLVNQLNADGTYRVVGVAGSVPTGCFAKWSVCEIPSENNTLCIPETAVNEPFEWYTTGVTNFPGYDGTSILSGEQPGIFDLDNRWYKITLTVDCCCGAGLSSSVVYPNDDDDGPGGPRSPWQDDQGENTTAPGAQSVQNAGVFRAVPNPATNAVRLERKNGNVDNPVTFTVYNMTGSKISEGKLESGILDLELDISTWSQGTYQVIVHDQNGSTEQLLFIKS